ncbi:FAD-binding protein [Photorhabdus heterorhabditis]|uniref:FAD-binding protein n=1 Tax=Photorhabdus heterorhabditis TaxID=880156 RepID=A0ABR5K8B3_9GAMM|nr:siderophore-interacting protein [Photorhabdus heterorhabditis]KOY60835.1 FAD-binding protein [Photorhabdus heterorhabditis]
MTTKPIEEKNIYRPAPPRLVQVKNIFDVTPNMRRITFESECLDSYPTECEGGLLKIFLPLPGQTKPILPTLSPDGPVWPADEFRPITRAYSVRALRTEQKEIDIEFALHHGGGPAVEFAYRAKIGDWIGITNPGGPDPLLPTVSHYYMAGDPSALPAIAALLETINNPDATGQVIIRVESELDIQDLKKPEGISIHWAVGNVKVTNDIVSEFKSWSLPTEDVTFWLAGEDKLVKELRRYVRREKGYERHQLCAIPYWRYGFNEDGYHDLRDEVMMMNRND